MREEEHWVGDDFGQQKVLQFNCDSARLSSGNLPFLVGEFFFGFRENLFIHLFTVSYLIRQETKIEHSVRIAATMMVIKDWRVCISSLVNRQKIFRDEILILLYCII